MFLWYNKEKSELEKQVKIMTEYQKDLLVQKAKAKRYKKPLSKEFNIESIQNTIWDILDAVSDIEWMEKEDVVSEILEDADEATEFKNAFGILAGDAYTMSEALKESYNIPECFDIWFAGMGSNLMGFDEYEGDYFDLSPGLEESIAQDVAQKRIMAMTKKDIVNTASQCFRIALNYLSIKSRYESLQDALDILRGKNCEQLKMMDELDKLYAEMQDGGLWDGSRERKFDRLTAELQQEVWL